MSRFDEHPSDMTIAGLGDTSPFGRVTAGMLAGNKAQIGVTPTFVPKVQSWG